MINLQFQIANPFSSRFSNLLSTHGTIGKNKAWEANAYRTNSIIMFDFNLTFRGDHAGLQVQVGVFGFEGEFHFYDTRHWDRKNECWEKHDAN
jgi:hypothetical protein